MNSVLAPTNPINERPVADILRKQGSIYRLFPQFDDRVDAVAAAGGVRLVDEGPDSWKFTVNSATVEGKKYNVTIHFADIAEMIQRYAGDRRYWNKDKTSVDVRKLAAVILDHVDVKIDHPDCPAFLYWGQKYIATKRDTSYLDHELRRPKIRNPKEYGQLCKHLQLIFDVLPFYTSTFSKLLKRNYSDEIEQAEDAMRKTVKGVRKAADYLSTSAKPKSTRSVKSDEPDDDTPPDTGETPETPDTPTSPDNDVDGGVKGGPSGSKGSPSSGAKSGTRKAAESIVEMKNAETGEYSYASVQADIDAMMANAILEYSNELIPDSDVLFEHNGEELGRENRPHITVKYGIVDATANDLRRILKNTRAMKAVLGETKMFESKSSEKPYDVVYIEVFSQDFSRINALIQDSVKCVNTQPKYVPHVTLAYVKQGSGRKYIGRTKFLGKELQFNRVFFSDRGKAKTDIELKPLNSKV